MRKIFILIFAACGVANPLHASPYAEQVIQYVPGSIRADYQNPNASLGKTASSTPVVVTPFNAPFAPSELTGIGPGGKLVLKLGQPAATGHGYTLGVHAGVNLTNVGGTSGQAANPATTFNFRRADVRVSSDNVDWIDLAQNVVFNSPTNWFSQGVTDPSGQTTPGTVEADFSKPFTGSLASFNGLTYAQILTLLDGSAGGRWFDLTNVALPEVNYVEFDVGSDDGQMYVDMLAVAPVPEPTAFLPMIASVLLLRRRLIPSPGIPGEGEEIHAKSLHTR